MTPSAKEMIGALAGLPHGFWLVNPSLVVSFSPKRWEST
jgi:hypothetical protein